MQKTSAQVPASPSFHLDDELTDRWSFHVSVFALGIFLLSPMVLGMVRRFGAMVCAS